MERVFQLRCLKSIASQYNAGLVDDGGWVTVGAMGCGGWLPSRGSQPIGGASYVDAQTDGSVPNK